VSAAPPAQIAWARFLRRALFACGCWLLVGVACAQPQPQDRPAWATLTAAQQQALAPLERTWSTIDKPRRQKWLEVAARFPAMPPAERQRVQERMAAWAALTPKERARARLQFQETRQIGAEEREARWRAYQSLPETERRALAQAARKAAHPAPAAAVSLVGGARAQAKDNVTVPPRTPKPRPVTATVVQAQPGVSTTTMTTRPTPPRHYQPGLPKIVATPGFVDQATLLPKRGPQGAAMRSAASQDPTRQP